MFTKCFGRFLATRLWRVTNTSKGAGFPQQENLGAEKSDFCSSCLSAGKKSWVWLTLSFPRFFLLHFVWTSFGGLRIHRRQWLAEQDTTLLAKSRGVTVLISNLLLVIDCGSYPRSQTEKL